MKEYLLYLDESETHTQNRDYYFCIAGIIVEKNDYKNYIQPAVQQLKRIIWARFANPTALILHEKDIKTAATPHRYRQATALSAEYRIFRQRRVLRQLYSELGNMFLLDKMLILGGCIDISKLHQYFNTQILSDKYLIALQIILENYIHFLSLHNGIGNIYYESRGEAMDKEIRLRVNHIKAIGSMFINPYAFQRHLRDINFPNKLKNIEGLQIADFIPNAFARHAAGLSTRDSMYNIARQYRYTGNIDCGHGRFGVKYIP